MHASTQERTPGSSAAGTAFCALPIDGPGGLRLWIDGNGKITASGGTLDNPVPNAFSLMHIADCPGATDVCRAACYVHGLARHAADIFALYQQNSCTMRAILADPALVVPWAKAMAGWIVARGLAEFRWHVAGDIFAADYARFIALVCQHAQDVRFWLYTRSLEFVPLLWESAFAGGNLVVNISADRTNLGAARVVAMRYGLRLCYLAQPNEEGIMINALGAGDVIFPDYALRGATPAGRAWFAGLAAHHKRMVCPVDFHGKSETRRCGPCRRCLI